VTGSAVEAPAARPAALRVQRWTPTSGVFTAALAALLVLLVFVPQAMSENAMQNLISLFVLVILAVMWNALAGFGGLVSVGQQAFIGIAAYGALEFGQVHAVNPFLSLLFGALIAGAIAIPLGFVVLQLRGGGFAIATWVVADAAMIIVEQIHGLQGGTGLSFNNLSLTYNDPHRRLELIYWCALGAMALLLVAVFVLLRTRTGAALQAIRDDEEAASSVGVLVFRNKFLLWVLAALGCGAAGSLILAQQFFVNPPSIFTVNYSADMLFMVLVGGIGTFEGPIIGAIVLFVIQNEMSNGGVWYYVLIGGVAIAVALVLPRGIWGTVVDRFGVRLLPVGYRVRGITVRRTGGRPA
jgi:branched-chain amino acid transport system permease protein